MQCIFMYVCNMFYCVPIGTQKSGRFLSEFRALPENRCSLVVVCAEPGQSFLHLLRYEARLSEETFRCEGMNVLTYSEKTIL